MKVLSAFSAMLVVVVLSCLGAGCGSSSGGGGGGGTSTQYTLDVQADLTITPTGAAQTVGKIQQAQVMIGTAILEVSNDATEELGLDFINFDLQPQASGDVDLQIVLNPSVTSTAVIYKTCALGVPFGTSYLDLSLAVNSLSGITFEETGDNVLSDDGQTLIIGGILRGEAEAGDRSRIPILSDVPVINFLFQGEQHEARLQNLMIILTPTILDDTHG